MMSKSFDGTISEIQVIEELADDVLEQLKSGFSLAMWFDAEDGRLLSSTIYPPQAASGEWHHATSAFATNRTVHIHTIPYSQAASDKTPD